MLRGRTLEWGVLAASIVLLVVNVWDLGIVEDEQIQLSAILHQPLLEHANTPLDLYDFSHVGEGDDPTADLQAGHDLVFRGAVKWCQAPFPYHLRFFRPVASAALALEYELFGFRFRLYHLFQLGLLLATCALFSRLANRALVATGRAPLSVPLATGLLALNPISQELLARICTVHYLLAGSFVLLSYLALARDDLAPAWRFVAALVLGALGLLAGEVAVPMNAVGTCLLAAQARRLGRSQRIAWLVVVAEVGAYLLWYHVHRHLAEGRGYLGETGNSFLGIVERPVDAALDLFAGTFIGDLPTWKSSLVSVGRRLGWGAVAAAVAFGGAIASYVAVAPRARAATKWLLAATALGALPVAVVAQDKLRVLALPSLPLQFLLCVMLRDGWQGLAARLAPGDADEPTSRSREVRGLVLAGVVLGYATLRLGTDVLLTPIAIQKDRIASHIIATRWLGARPFRADDVESVDLARGPATTDAPNILFVSGTTGVPYPFGPALLRRNGFPPDVESWLFVSDLPPGGTRVYRATETKFRVSLSAEAVAFTFRHDNQYPLMQRCFAMGGSSFHTRFADFFVYTTTTHGEPVDFDLVLAESLHPKFWSLRAGRIVPVTPPEIGRGAIF